MRAWNPRSFAVPLAAAAALLGGCGPAGSGAATVAVAVVDLDGDGRPDVVGINEAFRGSHADPGFVSVRRQGPTGAPDFVAPIRSPTCLDPISVAVGDVDGDGRPDLAVACLTAAGAGFEVDVLLQRADQPGAFAAPVALPLGARRPLDLRLSDLDGDGRLDLAVAALGGTSLLVFPQAAGGGFGASVEVDAGGEPQTVEVVDLTGAGRLDLVAGLRDGRLSVILHDAAAGTFLPPSLIPVGTDLVALAAADLDGDGHPDLVAADFVEGGIWVVRQAAAGGATFQAPEFHDSLDVGTLSLVVTDLDGDGRPDVAAASLGQVGFPGSVSIFFQRVAGALSVPTVYIVAGPTGIAAADIDGDGRTDLVVADGEPLVFLQAPAPAPAGVITPAYFLRQ